MTDLLDYVYNPVFWIILNVVLVILLAAVIHNISRVKRTTGTVREEDREYRELLKAIQEDLQDGVKLTRYVNSFLDYSCKRLGVSLPRGATLREVIRALSLAKPDDDALLTRLCQLYEPIRFGGKKPSEEELSTLRSLLIEELGRISLYASRRHQQGSV